MKYLKYKPMKFENGDNLYFISDLHFDHKNIISFCNRPFENVEIMNAALINNWNSIVTNDDYVFILGDFCFNNYTRWNDILSKLLGKKILILGNHDYAYYNEKLDKHFIAVVDRLEIIVNGYRTVLSHYPMLTWNGINYGAIQLFGHIHNDSFFNDKIDWSKQLNVCVENIDYKPISYKQILERIASAKLHKLSLKTLQEEFDNSFKKQLITGYSEIDIHTI